MAGDRCDIAPQMPVSWRQAAKLPVRSVFWMSISRHGLVFDDIAVEGIFRVADAKLCFYLNLSVSQPALNGCVREGAAPKQRGSFSKRNK